MAQFLTNTLYLFSIQCLLAVSFFLLFKPTRYFHVGHAVAVLISAYVAILVSRSSLGALALPAALILGPLTAACWGGLAQVLYGTIKRDRDASLLILVLSLGLYVVFQNIFSVWFGDRLIRVSDGAGLDAQLLATDTIAISRRQGLVAVIAAGAILGLIAFWYGTGIGRLARALSDNYELAVIRGIEAGRVVQVLAIISAAGAGLAGTLAAIDTGVTPTTGFNVLVPALTAVIVGGNAGLLSAIAGAALVSLVQTSSAFLLGSKWESFAAYALLIAVLLLRPSGIASLPMRKA